MPYEVLEKKIKAIPSEYLEEFSVYVDDFLLRVRTNHGQKPEPQKAENEDAEVQARLRALYEFAGSMKDLWKGVDALEYQRKLREDRDIG